MMGMDIDNMFFLVLILSIAAGIGFGIGIEIKDYLAKIINNLIKFK